MFNFNDLNEDQTDISIEEELVGHIHRSRNDIWRLSFRTKIGWRNFDNPFTSLDDAKNFCLKRSVIQCLEAIGLDPQPTTNA